jgi:hypothetical protein
MTDKELIQALQCCAEGECKGCAVYADKQSCQENVLSQAAERLEELSQRVPQWIPVTERLPDDDDGDWCLVYADGQEGSLVYRKAVQARMTSAIHSSASSFPRPSKFMVRRSVATSKPA